MVEYPVVVDEFTRAELGKLARERGITYGQVIRLLIEQLGRETVQNEQQGV